MGVLFEVNAEIGPGLQEEYYQKAIEVLLQEKKILFESQVPYNIVMKDRIIGRYFLDFLVEEKIVLEIKRGDRFSRRNITQVKGYLHQTNLQLGILANFTSRGVKYMRVLNIQ
jgi:GxxExxY protein